MCIGFLRPIFDIYALSLPRGHAFGDRPPVEAWQSEDALAWGAVTRDVNDGSFGVLVMRRREDYVWVTVHQEHGFLDSRDAQTQRVAPKRDFRFASC
jgi:hypothetical protein